MLGFLVEIFGWVGIAVSCVLVIQLLRLLRADCDLTLEFYARWGKQPKSLRGKVVWITGASSGLGEELAYVLAQSGAKLILSARREVELKRVLGKCKELSPEQFKNAHMVLPLDLLDYSSHSDACNTVLQQYDRIDVLVNNAGRSQRAVATETKLEVDRACLELNTLGTISMTKAVLPHFLKQKEGTIVVTSSAAGKLGSPGSASYCTSKHALQGFFDTLRMEVISDGIHVLMVCPGPVHAPASNMYGTELSKPVTVPAATDWKNRVSGKRVAYLTAVAIANQLHEVWISYNPVLFFVYVWQYAPSIGKWMGNQIGPKRSQAVKAGLQDIEGSYLKTSTP